MNDITFTGIKGLHTYKIKNHNNPDNPILRISAKLSNDADGYDLSDYFNYLRKSRKEYREYCKNFDDPTAIELDCLTINEKGFGKRNAFKLNRIPLLFDRDEVIPIFEFLARFTKRAAESTTSPVQKEFINKVNSAITEAAAKYFEIPLKSLFRDNHKRF